MTKRAVLYARVSGDDRKYATSGIESQLTDCRKYAEDRGYSIVGEFFETPDKQTSGSDWLPELDRVMKLASQDVFDVMVVREIDRLARNRFKQLSIEVDLTSLNIQVEYVIGQFEDSAEGRLLKGMMSEFAEYEREQIKARTNRGRLRSVTAGNVTIGGSYAPYGYDLATEGDHRVLVIDEKEAAIVRQIFHLYVNEQSSLHGIANYLDSNQVPKPAKGNNHKKRTNNVCKKGWSVGTIHGILNNETYVGRWYFRKTKSVRNPKTGKNRNIPRPKNEWILIDVPAIIQDEGIFQEAARKRKANKRQKGKNRKHLYALGGMLKCGHCGNNMSGITRVHGENEFGYYKCNARHLPKRYGFKCENPQYKVKQVEGVVWEWIKSILVSPQKLQTGIAEHQASQKEILKPLVGMIESNEKLIIELIEKRARLIQAYSAGVLSLDELAIQKTELDKRIDDLKLAIQDLTSELEPKLLSAQDIASIEQYAESIKMETDLTDDDPNTQRQLYQLVDMQVMLTCAGEKRFADVECVFGKKRLSTDYITNSFTAKKSAK